MADSRQVVKHYRGSGVTNNIATAPLQSAITEGEIAINYNSNDPSLFIKGSDGSIKKFSADAAIENKISGAITELTATTLAEKSTSGKDDNNLIQVTATTKGGQISAVTVGATKGAFNVGATEQKEGIATVNDATKYVQQEITKIGLKEASAGSASNYVGVSATTTSGNIKSIAVSVTDGTFGSTADTATTDKQVKGIATVEATQAYVDKRIGEVEGKALGIKEGTNVKFTTVTESDKSLTQISVEGKAVSATNAVDTDLALRKDVAAISGDVKFTGAVTAITTGNSYVSATKGTNSYSIGAVTGAISTAATSKGKLADAQAVATYVDDKAVTGATGDTFVKANLESKVVKVSAVTASTTAATPATGLATAADAKVTMTSGSSNGVTTFTFSQGTREIGKLSIDKERFVTGGEVKQVKTADSPYTGAKVGDYYIDLELVGTGKTNDHLYIPANSLIDDYKVNSGSTAYLKINGREIGIATGNGALATYEHLTTLSGNVVTELNKKANAEDYKIKSGANGTNTTVAISEAGVLTVSANGTSVSAVTDANKATALALADELKTLSGKVGNYKAPVSSVTGSDYITATTTAGVVTVKATTAAVSSTTTTGLVLNSDVNAELKKKSDTGHTHTEYIKTGVTITNQTANKISATTDSQVLTLNFNNMVIDCGTY